MASVALGLGSNIGDRIGWCRQAVDAMGLHPEVRIVKGSSWYETRPVGYKDQPDFINGAVLAETTLTPTRLLDTMKEVESRLGRTASWKCGPREIDLDLLLYDDLVFDSPGLVLPHPAMTERAFVLVPLSEIQPGRVHPVDGRAISDLLEDLKPVDHLVRRVCGP